MKLSRTLNQWFLIGSLSILGCTGSQAPPVTAKTAVDGSATTEDHSTSAVTRVEGETLLPKKLNNAHLPNAVRIHTKVISGGQPDGEDAFRELRDLGVKTVISVDGAKPDLELATKYGMTYVHLPHSYDGIPDERVKELAKAVRDLDGPIYIHCHHGKHRSPAAAAVACVSAGLIDPSVSLTILKIAGTNVNYRGLYQSAESARKLDQAVLDAVESDFPEIATLPAMAEAMVNLEHTLDRLKLASAADWILPASHPDVDPAHEALLLTEHFTEMLRSESVAKEPDAFQKLLRDSEAAGSDLEDAILSWNQAGMPTPVPEAITSPFDRITKNCTACHQQFRDVPLSEKSPK